MTELKEKALRLAIEATVNSEGKPNDVTKLVESADKIHNFLNNSETSLNLTFGTSVKINATKYKVTSIDSNSVTLNSDEIGAQTIRIELL